jgi:cyclophilin family peptidyl-prolyl cis-trans isomerase
MTLGDDINDLDAAHTVFGHVVEGLDILDKSNEVFLDPRTGDLSRTRGFGASSSSVGYSHSTSAAIPSFLTLFL